MFLDEARLAARIRHPHVVSVLDVVEDDAELYLVMDYVHGGSLAELLRLTPARVDTEIAVAVLVGALRGLDGAHRLTDRNGGALGLVHRDVSPQNILVGLDGLARIADFGIAKAASRLHTTREGQLKGKIPYMSPEQLRQQPVDCRSDIFAAGAVCWECLTGRKLFRSDDDAASTVLRVVQEPILRVSELQPDLEPRLSEVVARALERDPGRRYASAAAFADALEEAVAPARPTQVATWVESLLGQKLTARRDRILEIERDDVPEVAARTHTAELAVVSTETSTTEQRRRSRVGIAVVIVLALATLTGVTLALSAPPLAAPDRLSKALVELRMALPQATSADAPAAPAAPPAINAPVRARPKSVTRGRPAPACNPPYVLRADGTKQFKKGCF
jgi:serine/threonine-protein kinase